jgi:hypothetical protein
MIACVMVDGDREYTVPFYSDAWLPSLEWAKFHGLDPRQIPNGSRIVRDAPNRRILYTEFVKTGPEVADILIVDSEPVTVARVEQGEAPPLPFPREVTG